MDQFSATDICNTSIRDLLRIRLILKRRNLLTLLNENAFYPLSTWPQAMEQLFRRKPFGDTGTFKLMLSVFPEWWLLLALGNRMDSHISTLGHIAKKIKRARQINSINSNLDSEANIWFYYQISIVPLGYFSIENSEIPILCKFCII